MNAKYLGTSLSGSLRCVPCLPEGTPTFFSLLLLHSSTTVLLLGHVPLQSHCQHPPVIGGDRSRWACRSDQKEWEFSHVSWTLTTSTMYDFAPCGPLGEPALRKNLLRRLIKTTQQFLILWPLHGRHSRFCRKSPIQSPWEKACLRRSPWCKDQKDFPLATAAHAHW